MNSINRINDYYREDPTNIQIRWWDLKFTQKNSIEDDNMSSRSSENSKDDMIDTVQEFSHNNHPGGVQSPKSKEKDTTNNHFNTSTILSARGKNFTPRLDKRKSDVNRAAGGDTAVTDVQSVPLPAVNLIRRVFKDYVQNNSEKLRRLKRYNRSSSNNSVTSKSSNGNVNNVSTSTNIWTLSRKGLSTVNEEQSRMVRDAGMKKIS